VTGNAAMSVLLRRIGVKVFVDQQSTADERRMLRDGMSWGAVE